MLCKQKLALGLTAFVLLYSIPMVSAQCSAYCTLTYSQTNRVTIASCVNTLSTGCIACDATYFDFIAGQCVAHNRYGEFLDNLYTIDATWLGDNAGLAYTATYYTETVLSFDGFTNNKWASKQMNVVNPHWAVRLRFFLAWDTTASSTIIYGVDEYYFTYDK